MLPSDRRCTGKRRVGRDFAVPAQILGKSLRRHGQTATIVTDCLASEGAALGIPGAIDKREQAAG